MSYLFTPPNQWLAEVDAMGLICASRAMRQVLEQVNKVCASNVTILITGESGTGKELIARALHAGSPRCQQIFLPFNCSATPRDMIESLLFGYRKGAFTGAVANSDGVICAAEQGTLFLDEIGELPMDLQPKLLRFLQASEIHPLGERRPVRVNVRVVAATNIDLEQAVANGKFREDLFYRLNVVRLHVPPLRERREEIPVLIAYYLKRYQTEAGKSELRLAQEAVDLLTCYDWPGNVRQLCNELQRLVLYSEPDVIITADALSAEIAPRPRALTGLTPNRIIAYAPSSLYTLSSGATLGEAVAEFERHLIREALHRCSDNKTAAAKELGLSRRGLYKKMRKLGFKEANAYL